MYSTSASGGKDVPGTGVRGARRASAQRGPIVGLVRAAVCLWLIAACGGDTQPFAGSFSAHGRMATKAVAERAVEVTNDGGHLVRLDRPARRIVSLIPSANETLIAIGAAGQIVGRTRYDVAPELVGLPSVGGGMDPSIEAILALAPDVVIGWENDRRRGPVARFAALGLPAFTLRSQDTTDMFRGMANLGALTGREAAASALTARLRVPTTGTHPALHNFRSGR